MKKNRKNKKTQKFQEGLPEFLTAAGILVLAILLIGLLRSCSSDEESVATDTSHEIDVFEDTSAPTEDTPASTVLNPIPADGIRYPVQITAGITADQLYAAAGYFTEDGSDKTVENVLSVKLTNTTDRTLEYLTAALTVNGEVYNFAVTTVPAGESVYVFNTDCKIAPDTVTSITGMAEFEIYFAQEPSVKSESLSYDIQNGTIVVTNVSGKDIISDIVVYYKTRIDSGYLGGITYRFTVSGGLAAGASYNAYAPHSYAHRTEIMFTQCE